MPAKMTARGGVAISLTVLLAMLAVHSQLGATSPKPDGTAPYAGPGGAVPLSEEAIKQMAELEKYEPFDPRRADVLEQLAKEAQTDADRAMWYQQMADTLSAAALSGKDSSGLRRIESLHERLRREKADKAIIAYVRFRVITSGHAQSLQSPTIDYPKIQADFHSALERFVEDYPTAPDAAEAMLQLGIGRECEARETEAKKWYNRIVREFAGAPAVAKAKGAMTRLNSDGRVIALHGRGITGRGLELSDFRGKIVLIHYWATWSEQCRRDVPALKALADKYEQRLVILGVGLDNDRKAVTTFLTEHKVSWPQIFEEGGLDSSPANQLGILAVPTMLLVDPAGKLVNRSLGAAELEAEVKKLLR